jgi:hypothetical protein
MKLQETITDLRRDRDLIDEAIAALERLAAGRGKRRGRPPNRLKQQLPDAMAKQQVTAKSDNLPLVQ